MQNFKSSIVCALVIVLFSRAGCNDASESGIDADAGINPMGLVCGTIVYPGLGPGKFMETFVALMEVMAFQIKDRGWGAERLVSYVRPMYALGSCRHDLSPDHCFTCFLQARHLLSSCVPKVSGRIFLDGCFLRYDNYRFFQESVDYDRDARVCESPVDLSSGEGGDKRAVFAANVTRAIESVTKEAPGRGNKFAARGEEGVFVMAQCWETVEREGCERCLSEAAKLVEKCAPDYDDGRGLFAGCYLRYSTHKFYNDIIEDGVRDDYDGRPRTRAIVVSVSSAIALALMVIGAVLTWKKIPLRGKRGNDGLPSFANNAGFNYKYDLLLKATNNFDPGNKIGQGGAGSVFKGTLPSGKTVAVKRLFFNTRQWADGFFNEVNLINGIQHKNVVKLLGCSIEGPESLLVYEFVPNGSLDQILFGKEGVNALTWQQRFQIICGIAEGLAYLHGGSGSKIIHRDIKSGNILLDKNLNPKIADFGLARCVTDSRSHVSTGIAGTLGYMAPEYLIRGQLTEKADVYAFGVLIVEIVCGKKNSVYTQGSTSVLHGVWKNYRANNITASVDPTLRDQFVPEEASNALRAGLLCTQSSDNLRPSMSELVQILTRKDYVFPSPRQQPFLNSTMLSPDDRTQTSTISIVTAIEHTSARSSFHSTTSSVVSSEDSVGRNSFSSTTHFISTGRPESSIQTNIEATHPR